MKNPLEPIAAGLGLPAEPLDRLIGNLLELPGDVFDHAVREPALAGTRREFGNAIFVCGLLAFSSACGHDCTYCGLRRSNQAVPRYRLSEDEIRSVIDRFRESGLTRIFLVSAEDRSYTPETIRSLAGYAKSQGLHVTLGLGEYPEETLKGFRDAGADCFTLKFETSNPDLFSRIKPTSEYASRMNCIRAVRRAGMELGSGNIIGLAGQTERDIARDIALMHELAIDWAPVVPYMPAPGTPMAETTPMGDVGLTLRTLSIIRLLLPRALITAGQPSQGSKLGFADPEGNRCALEAGANLLFVDMTPHAVRKDFRVTEGRILPGLAQIDTMLGSLGLTRGA